MSKINYSNQEFVMWFSNGLREYLDNTFRSHYTTHIEDLMYATASYTEAVVAFTAAQPKG